MSSICPAAAWPDDKLENNEIQTLTGFCPSQFGPTKMTKRGQKLDHEDKNRIWWGQNWDFEDKYWSYLGHGHIWDIGWIHSGQIQDIGQSLDKSRDTYIDNQHQTVALKDEDERAKRDGRLIYGNSRSGMRRRRRWPAVTGKFVAINDFTLFDRYVCFPARVRYHM